MHASMHVKQLFHYLIEIVTIFHAPSLSVSLSPIAIAGLECLKRKVYK
jgi:hypothetical protein